jgi:DNA-binding CsgD family transcriptional regulator
MAQTYLAIIGDVVGSKEVEDRRNLQQRLRVVVDRANRLFTKTIAAGFVLTIGDEFQGLMSGVDGVDKLLADIRASVYPIELRFGLGIGGLETPLEMVALGMDGPCFHRARSAIERAATRETLVEVEAAQALPAFHIYSLLYAGLRERWTSRQKQVFDLSMSGVAGKSIALRLGVTASAVSQHLRAAEAERISSATQYWIESLRIGFRMEPENV